MPSTRHGNYLTSAVVNVTLTVTAVRRWIFWINLPLTGFALVVCPLVLPQKHMEGGIMGKLKKIDYAGTVMTIAFSTLFAVRVMQPAEKGTAR